MHGYQVQFQSKGHKQNNFHFLFEKPQSRSQSCVPLDQRSENESSGSLHFRHAPLMQTETAQSTG